MMLQLPKRNSSSVSLYAKFGLRDLPFPTEPVVDPYNVDPRRNGAIYAEEPVRPAIEKFEQLLIRPNDFQNRVRLAYLWAKGDQQTGRGMGKTALLRYFRHRINNDWGFSEFGGQFSALVVYVSFPTQVDRRYMEQLSLSALVDVCKNGVLDASRVWLRHQQLTEEQVTTIVKNDDGTDVVANLLDDRKLQARDIDPVRLNEAVADHLVKNGLQRPVALALARGDFESYLREFRRDHSLEPFYVPRDTKILDYSRTLLFNDVVLYLHSAGFGGGYLFIDDIENLVDQMARRDRIEFAKEFGLCTVRPGYANTAHNFFSCVLCTHQQASVSLSNAWGEAGLSGIARLDPSSPNSVELPLPSPDQAREIVVAHLDYFRMDPANNGTITPFTEDGLTALLANRQHPRVLLSSAATVIARAAQVDVQAVDAAFVNLALETSSVPATRDFSEGIGDAV
jgi:hypothetical protein